MATLKLFIVGILWMFSMGSFAGSAGIAVLDFELNDLTLNPDTVNETERVASIKPLLNNALVEKQGYRAIDVDPLTQKRADAGFGYLFDHHDVAAQLGRDAGAEWVVVGRLHKPTFLFSYLMAHVVNVETGQLAGDLVVEIKGAHSLLTAKGVENLAGEITKVIENAGYAVPVR